MDMTSYQIAEVKTRLSAVLKEVERGEDVMITRGRSKEPVAYIVSPSAWKKSRRFELGSLAHWGPFTYDEENWHFDDEGIFENA
jgi:prevent-host-death family protein